MNHAEEPHEKRPDLYPDVLTYMARAFSAFLLLQLDAADFDEVVVLAVSGNPVDAYIQADQFLIPRDSNRNETVDQLEEESS